MWNAVIYGVFIENNLQFLTICTFNGYNVTRSFRGSNNNKNKGMSIPVSLNRFILWEPLYISMHYKTKQRIQLNVIYR